MQDKILKILREEGSLKAKEIAKILNQRYNLQIDKREVNKILYYELKGRVKQDSSYKWSIADNLQAATPVNHVALQADENRVQTPLSILSSYYLECLSKDRDDGISCYASSRYGSPDYGQLTKLPQFADPGEDIYSSVDARNAIRKVSADSNRLVLYLGYPINLRKVVARTEFYVVEPLLTIPFETDSLGQGNLPVLSNELPQFNYEAVAKISGLDKNELLEEVFSLTEELGLNNPPEDQPELDEIVVRLRDLRPHWNWIGDLEPENLTTNQLKTEPTPGIYNTAALFFSERSKFTQGLEKELSDFKAINTERYGSTALGHWILRSIPACDLEEKVLIEPIPLNEEQREAVKKSLQVPLTVVTGPPGTGKSQVVTSIIINAVYQGQKVLFASKNNKAVDVVNDRVNGLSSRPVMIRLGNNQLQSKLAEYLTGLLSATTTQDDKARHDSALNLHNTLLRKIEEVKEKQDLLIRIRNEVDAKEQNVERYRQVFGEELFDQIRSWEPIVFDNIDAKADEFQKALYNLDKGRQQFFTRLFWFLHRKSRLEISVKALQDLKDSSAKLGLTLPGQDLSERNLTEFQKLLSMIKERSASTREVYDYLMLLNKLKSSEDLFALAKRLKLIEEEIANNSQELWENWMNLIPDKLTPENRRVLQDFATLVNLIVTANVNQNQIPKSVFARYYQLLPSVATILSCWAVTSLSVRGKVPAVPGFFDLVIIDEASQCDIASALPLLYRAKRAVIIGDSKQLTHISKINERQDMQLIEKYNLQNEFLSWSYSSNSLFGLSQSICRSDDIVVLKDHHRSHADIIEFSNSHFYQGNLRVATNYERLRRLDSGPAIRWIDFVGQVTSPASGGSLNVPEANQAVSELRRIIGTGYDGSIGVVTPFNAQATRIRDLVFADQDLSSRLISRDFLADTVHKFQGDERDLMIFSPVISNGIGKGSLYFLSRTGNLFNVAITRARAALIVVGDMASCSACSVDYMRSFVEYFAGLHQNHNPPVDSNVDLGREFPAVPAGALVSEWEKILYKRLYDEGIRTIPQYKVEQYSLDLAAFNNDRKLDIEIDGEKYHRSWDGELCRRDQLRNRRLIELGWDVQRFWVYQVRDDIEYCVSKVKNWLNRNQP